MDTIYDLSNTLPRIQSFPTCSTCGLIYNRKWMMRNHIKCFFCSKFNIKNVTRNFLLKETDWFYIQSGEDHRQQFYEDYFEHLHRWSNHFQLSYTSNDKILELNLLSSIIK